MRHALTHETVELVVTDEVRASRYAGVAAGTLMVLVDTLTNTLLTVPVTTRSQGRVPHLIRHTHGATEVVVQCCHLQGHIHRSTYQIHGQMRLYLNISASSVFVFI